MVNRLCLVSISNTNSLNNKDFAIKENLSHLCLASHFWDLDKQCKPWSDAAEPDQGLLCLQREIGIQIS